MPGQISGHPEKFDDPKDTENWRTLKKEIDKLTGFDTGHYKENFLKRRVYTRLYCLRIKSYREYSIFLSNNNAEKEELLKELTIHVTNFFRNIDTFNVFIAQTMMKILKEKEQNRQKSLKIWSAGCSTGEEPYSLAMILSEVLGLRMHEFKISIIGTDISTQTIEKARLGQYEKNSLKEAPLEYIEKYFEKKDGFFIINNPIKRLVQFETGDILKEKDQIRPCDIIFCRNTIIYFEDELKKKIMKDFYSCLNPGGYLVLGMSESLIGPAREMFIIDDNINRIYKKIK